MAAPVIPLVVIVGPTASGKTSLAIRLAKEYDGEVISADSRAIYRGLDIGTAKPSKQEQQAIPHWGIDIADPSQRFTVVDFKHYAEAKIADIRRRGKVPLLVGGTGLYVDAIVYDYEFGEADIDLQRRDELQQRSLEELHEYCQNNNIPLPKNHKNKRHVVQAILRRGVDAKRRQALIPDTIVVGITTQKELLRQRIVERADDIVTNETIQEAIDAARRSGWETEAMTGNIYPLIRRYLDGAMTLDEVKQRFVTLDWQLAKRQLTWLRRNQDIVWTELDRAHTLITRLLGDAGLYAKIEHRK